MSALSTEKKREELLASFVVKSSLTVALMFLFFVFITVYNASSQTGLAPKPRISESFASEDQPILAPTSTPDAKPPPAMPATAAVPLAEPPRPTAVAMHSPSVAVALIGGIRTFEFVKGSMLQNLVVALQPDPARRRVFFEVTLNHDCDANSVNKKIPAFMSECLNLFKKYTPAFFEDRDFKANWSQPIVSITGNFGCGHELLSGSECCKRFPHAHQDIGGIWGFSQYMRKVLALRNIKKYTAETGFKFDWVCLTRPDVNFFEPVPHVSYFDALSPRMFLASKEGDAAADYIHLVPASLVGNLEWSFIDVFSRNCVNNPGGNGGSPEWRIQDWWNNGDHLIPRQIFPFNFALARTHNWADCFRLANSVWRGSNPMHTPSDRHAMSAEEHCKQKFPKSHELREYG